MTRVNRRCLLALAAASFVFGIHGANAVWGNSEVRGTNAVWGATDESGFNAVWGANAVWGSEVAGPDADLRRPIHGDLA